MEGPKARNLRGRALVRFSVEQKKKGGAHNFFFRLWGARMLIQTVAGKTFHTTRKRKQRPGTGTRPTNPPSEMQYTFGEGPNLPPMTFPPPTLPPNRLSGRQRKRPSSRQRRRWRKQQELARKQTAEPKVQPAPPVPLPQPLEPAEELPGSADDVGEDVQQLYTELYADLVKSPPTHLRSTPHGSNPLSNSILDAILSSE
jgi:hypothetical protein